MLWAAVGILILVPVSTAAMVVLVPHQDRLIPLWFWVVWFLFSVWAALDLPLRVARLTPIDSLHQLTRYTSWAMVLALGNVVWSIGALIYLGWWS
jgi:uncharacterized membrane protein